MGPHAQESSACLTPAGLSFDHYAGVPFDYYAGVSLDFYAVALCYVLQA